MTLLATVVHWDRLLQVVWTAAAAGIGVTIIFSLAVYGVARSSDVRGERPAVATAFAIVGLVGFAASLAAIIWGLVLITSK